MNIGGKIIQVLVVVAVLTGVLGLAAASVKDLNRWIYTDIDQFAIQNVAPAYNLTLTHDDPTELIRVLGNCTKTLPAGNYTDYVSAGKFQIDSNLTYIYTNVCVTYGYGGHVGTATYVLLGTVVLFVVVGFIVYVVRNFGLARA